ncbi:Dot/Icm T4SS effector AnkD/LegA15 [Legionella nagasakiensis]|uniref:Dot/Icm T4SS effector AnkD/LegA15 n=1 Tax=Legionella nagasakiensis TaxID=535290 RepID=UPI001F5F28E1|nr:Dot/Icm T4SS effector AnkD/LegA15 [Legionella nagasakiensis]
MTNAFELLGKMHAASHDAKAMEDQMHAQKMHSDQIRADNERFFNFLIQLLQESLLRPIPDIKEQLQKAAKESGFDNLNEAINQVYNPQGQTPLLYAFQQQNFALAKQLMDFGATAGPIEKAAFEVALDSQAAKDYGLPPPPSLKGKELHTVKNFGVVLGIVMTSTDGTFSQFAHMSPTYQLMTDSVASYARTHPNRDFQAISDAFRFSNKAAAFSYSTSQRDPEAGREIADRIQRGQVTTIPVGCKGHVMGLSIVPDGPGSNSGYLVYTNRGLGTKPGEAGTQIFRLDDLRKVSPEFINTMMNGVNKGIPHDDILRQVHQISGNRPPVVTLPQGAQKYDNCTIANPRANIHGILLCQRAVRAGGFDKLTRRDFDDVKAEYKSFTRHMRASKIDELATALEKKPGDADLNKLAREYLKQHPKADPSMRERLEKAIERRTEGPTDASTLRCS